MKLQPSGAAGGDMLAPVEPVECGPVLLYMQVGFGGEGVGAHCPPALGIGTGTERLHNPHSAQKAAGERPKCFSLSVVHLHPVKCHVC